MALARPHWTGVHPLTAGSLFIDMAKASHQRFHSPSPAFPCQSPGEPPRWMRPMAKAASASPMRSPLVALIGSPSNCAAEPAVTMSWPIPKRPPSGPAACAA
ncbi:hypothetical protein BU16DRAFT_536340 [Lophium mytilinum]|uniref:Uncharacterized protein n=1 Tax=Lophium mytilinum TaxID=390894 RepID=A0A6A6R2Z9_9PEZI|nr:hypothetical protein BU16DRAFT_536340 [Lophium mytilinum]